MALDRERRGLAQALQTGVGRAGHDRRPPGLKLTDGRGPTTQRRTRLRPNLRGIPERFGHPDAEFAAEQVLADRDLPKRADPISSGRSLKADMDDDIPFAAEFR